MRALVIEDDKLYLIFVCKTLEKYGWHVDVAVNGRTALALMRERAFELVVTDIFMPEQEGMETIARIAAEFPDTRILAMSGGSAYPEFDVLEFARKLGAHGCISKPFLPNALMVHVADLLRPSAFRRPGTPQAT